MEDVHRAGGVFGILAELNRGNLLNKNVSTVHSETIEDAISKYDITSTQDESIKNFFRAAPGGVRTTEAFSQK